MFVGIVDAFRSMIGAFSFDISPVSYDACLFFMILLPILCKRLRIYTIVVFSFVRTFAP